MLRSNTSMDEEFYNAIPSKLKNFKPFRVRYSSGRKLTVMLLTPTMFLGGMYLFLTGFGVCLEIGYVQGVVLFVLGGAFCYLAYLWSGFLPHLSSVIAVDNKGIDLVSNGRSKRYNWEDLGLMKVRDFFQILELYDLRGNKLIQIPLWLPRGQGFLLLLCVYHEGKVGLDVHKDARL